MFQKEILVALLSEITVLKCLGLFCLMRYTVGQFDQFLTNLFQCQSCPIIHYRETDNFTYKIMSLLLLGFLD